MKKIILFLLITLHLGSLQAGTFHLLIAADTATKDVRRSSEHDIKTMKEAFRFITHAIDMPLKMKVLKSSDLTVKHLLELVHDAKVSKDDCFMFYYTGHGFGDTRGKTEWPAMYFKTKSEYLGLEAVQKAIEKKNPRLLVVLCDSCNNFAVPRSAIEYSQSIHRHYPETSGLKALFKHSKGRVIASASVRGRTSFGSNDGGWFTNGFLASLQKETERSHYSWKHLMKKTKRLLNRHSQYPQYKLDVH